MYFKRMSIHSVNLNYYFFFILMLLNFPQLTLSLSFCLCFFHGSWFLFVIFLTVSYACVAITARRLVLEDVLREQHVVTPHGSIISYICAGRNNVQVLQQRKRIYLLMVDKTQRNAANDRKEEHSVDDSEPEKQKQAIKEALMELRQQIAKEKFCNPSIIFTDVQLDKMAEEKPQDLPAFSECEVRTVFLK